MHEPAHSTAPELIAEINAVLKCMTTRQLSRVLAHAMLIEGSLPPEDRETLVATLGEMDEEDDLDNVTVDGIKELLDLWVEWGTCEKLPDGRYRLIPEKQALHDAKQKAYEKGWKLP
jgi:hypothetical protein